MRGLGLCCVPIPSRKAPSVPSALSTGGGEQHGDLPLLSWGFSAPRGPCCGATSGGSRCWAVPWQGRRVPAVGPRGATTPSHLLLFLPAKRLHLLTSPNLAKAPKRGGFLFTLGSHRTITWQRLGLIGGRGTRAEQVGATTLPCPTGMSPRVGIPPGSALSTSTADPSSRPSGAGAAIAAVCHFTGCSIGWGGHTELFGAGKRRCRVVYGFACQAWASPARAPDLDFRLDCCFGFS